MTKQIRRITRTAQSGHLVAYDSSQPPGHQIRIAWRDNLILATSIDNAKALQHLLTDVLALIDSEQSQPADAMTNTRKADALDWDWIETKCADDDLSTTHFRALIELRARVEALEAKQRLGLRPLNTETVYGSKPAVDTVQLHSYSVESAVKESFTTQPRGLVEKVANGICEALHCGDTPEDWETEARAAIRAVAAWMRMQGGLNAAELLEQEVDRG